MNTPVMRQIGLILIGILVAVAAAVLTISVFNIATPPRDIQALTNPTPTREIVSFVGPTSTPLPTPTSVPTDLIYSSDLTKPGDWPINDRYHYTQAGYLLSASSQSDFLAVPLKGFEDSSLRDLTIIAEANPPENNQGEYGAFFWHSTDSQGRERFLAVTITPRRTFRLRAYGPFTPTKGEKALRWVDIVPETPSRNIRIDGRPNLITVELHPGHIRVLINGFEVLNRENGDIDVYRFRSDFDARVGLIVVPTDNADANVAFTRFQLFYGNAADTASTP